MYPSPQSNERQIHLRLQAILSPLDRQLEWGNTLLAGSLLVVVPGTFLGLWLLSETGAKRALGWAVAIFALLLLLRFGWDAFISRLALWRFDRAFPPLDPLRGWAILYLNEVELATPAEEQLRDLLVRRGDASLVRPSASPSAVLTLGLDETPAIEPKLPQRPLIGMSSGASNSVGSGPLPQRPIALEPRQP
jgi:hypothetical protein